MNNKPDVAEIVVVAAAYGQDKVRELGGQKALLPIVAQSGAEGIEIRRELMTDAEIDQLEILRSQIREHQLFSFYSVPELLFVAGGEVNPNLPRFLSEAHQLGARKLKVALGYFSVGEDLTPLKVLLERYPHLDVVVENDQTSDCGILSLLNAFFYAAEASHLPVSMTFDMANWLWVGQDPLAAATRLAKHVGYVHVKAAHRKNGKLHAVALDDSDGSWQQVLAALPGNVARGIEFPLEGEDLTAITRHYVDLLRHDAR
ncbi:sugar phosphate isomerase/epimerase family protein [Rouxiella sp. Mn2063]|uniref:sugar phosphate isomerase/epimerase family protein n=1 Tax=Rouxiella sp. Mn2063 TaxID=3395262 RepID=UPI003BDC3997